LRWLGKVLTFWAPGFVRARACREMSSDFTALVVKALTDAGDNALGAVSEAAAETGRRAAERLRASGAVRERLSQINQRYSALVVSADPQSRGFELERLMYDLFELFDLDPKASFKNTGEQVDGAFSLEGTDYLFEAKWQKEPVSAQDLDGFASKTRRKLENTLGAFLSINGFSQDAVLAHSSGQPSIILMDGSDLMAVLEERIDFVSLFLRKKRHAAQTGNIYLRIHEIL